jgi:hypothetical protein
MKEHGQKEAKHHGILTAGLVGSGQYHFSPGETPQYLLARPQTMPCHFEEEDTFLIFAGNRTLILWWCIL